MADLHITKAEEDPELGLLRLVLSDGNELELAPGAPEAAGLGVGSAVAPERLAGLRDAAARKECARKVFQLLDRRRYCRARLREKLLAASHEPPIVEAVLDQFEGQGLVDDADYARAWVHDQLLRKPVGPISLVAKLREQGVSDADAREGLDRAYPHGREAELAEDALRRKRLDLGEERQRARALRFLRSRGFTSSAANHALRTLRAEQRADPGDDDFEEHEFRA